MTVTIENKGKYNCTTLKQSISFQYFFHVYFHTAMKKIIKTLSAYYMLGTVLSIFTYYNPFNFYQRPIK